MNPTDTEYFAQRLQRLEQENRRFKRAGFLALVGISMLFVMGQTTKGKQAPKVVEAQAFVVRDASGKMRGALGTYANGGTSLMFYNKDNKIAQSLEIQPDGTFGLYLKGTDGKNNATLTQLPNGTVGLALRAHDGAAGIATLDKAGKTNLDFGTDKDGEPRLYLADRKGKIRAVFRLANDEPVISFLDDSGNIRWKTP